MHCPSRDSKKDGKPIDLYILNILNEKQLDHELMKLSTNQRLEVKLVPKTVQTKSKPIKI